MQKKDRFIFKGQECNPIDEEFGEHAITGSFEYETRMFTRDLLSRNPTPTRPKTQDDYTIGHTHLKAEKIFETEQTNPSKSTNKDFRVSTSQLAIPSMDSCVIFNIFAMNPLKTMQKVPCGRLSCVKWLNDVLLCLASEFNVQMIDVDIGKRIRNLEFPPFKKANVNSITFQKSDQHILIAGDDEGDITFHDIRERHSLIRQVRSHKDEVILLKMNEGSYLGSVSFDQTIRIYDIRSDKTVKHTRLEDESRSFSWIGLDKFVVSHSSKKPLLKIFSAESDKILACHSSSPSFVTEYFEETKLIWNFPFSKKLNTSQINLISYGGESFTSRKYSIDISAVVSCFFDPFRSALIAFDQLGMFHIYNFQDLI
jgi:WD40 repeat protein